MDRRGLSLSSVIGGIVVAVALQILFMLLGAAIGLTALPMMARSQEATQLGYLVWLVAALVVSVFFGALVAAAGARSPFRGDGLLHGLVTWAALSLLGVFLIGANADALLGGALRLAGRTIVASAPTPAAAAVVAEKQAEVQGQVQSTVDEVKRRVSNASHELQAAGAVETAREGVAIGLWGYLGVEFLLLVVALAGGSLATRGERRFRRRVTAGVVRVPEPVTP